MMFLFRTAFWLVILILLLPTDEQQRNQIYGTAESAVHDVATFCDRNPTTCETGREAFGVLVQKAEYGAALLVDLVNKGANGSSEAASLPLLEPQASEGPALWERADSVDSTQSQDTLSPEDRAMAWSGPGAGT
jgi:hypothetical protein